MSEGHDPAELAQRLTLYALALFRSAPGRGDSIQGLGPEDLALGVLARHYDPRDAGVRWDARRGPLLAYLKRVLWGDFVDLLRTQRRRGFGPAAEEAAWGGEGPEAAAERRQWRERLLRQVADDVTLHAMLEMQISPEGHYQGYTNLELAARLQVPVAEIGRRKKRLARRLLALAPRSEEVSHARKP